MLFLAFVAGITSYEFQIAQQLTSIRLILANSKLGTPPGVAGDISSVSFGVAVPDHPAAHDPEAEARHWRRLEAFLAENLAG